MGFFFTKAKQKKKPGQRQAPASKQNADILHRLGCRACPLDKVQCLTPKMEPTIADETDILFLAEGPGRDEDENTGRPLTGPSGTLLRSCIPDGLEERCSFDNIVNCRPPENRTPVWSEIECCRPRREKYIPQIKPKLIVGLGLIPLQAVLGSSDMQGLRGRVFAISIGDHQCWFLPTYHPSYILRKALNKKKPLNSYMGFCFRMDIKRAFKRVEELRPARVDTPDEAVQGVQCFDGSGASHLHRVLGLINDARKAVYKAIDLETYPLRPYAADAKLLTVAISYPLVNFSFALEHPQAKWSKDDKQRLLAALEELLLDDTTKVAHNAPFEIEWLISRLGRKAVRHDVWECTQMQSHFIDERRGREGKGDYENRRAVYQSLDFLCKQYFGLAYKKLFKLNKKRMDQADLGQTLIYNGVDTKYTLRLFLHQREILAREGLQRAYEEALPRQPTVAIMQHIGIGVDQAENKKAGDKLQKEINEITAQIMDLKVVKAYIKDHKSYNPDSVPETIVLFKNYLKCKEIEYEEDGQLKYSVDKNVLAEIEHPLAGLLVRLRNRSKLKSTNVDPFRAGTGVCVWPDNRIHTSFNTTFTETGRTSSDEPNQQNWPKRNDAWVRRQVVAPPGHLLVAFDYGQLEGCTSAICSQDKVLVDALWEDYDLHMEWAKKTALAYPRIIDGTMADKAVAKKFRSLIKNKLVFPAIFGASNSSIAGYLRASTGVDIPENIVEDLMDEFWEMFAGLYKWQDQLMKGYYEDGYVTSPTGRRHHYPLSRNQAINFPIQGFAADIVCNAMNELSYLAIETGQWHLHPVLNIHDDLTFIVPDDDKMLEGAINTIYKTMLTPPYSVINVPMSVECSVGSNWLEMTEIGKFWSHKDL